MVTAARKLKDTCSLEEKLWLFVTLQTIACQTPSVHEILQAIILEWVARFSRRSFQLRDWTLVSCIVSTFFTVWATREAHDKPRQCIKKQRHHFANKGPPSQRYSFSSNHVWMWEVDSKEICAPKNWCFWTVVLEKALESPLDCKEMQPVNPKGNQPRIFIERTDAEAETPMLWPPDVKNWLIGRDPEPGNDWRQEEKGTTEDEMVGWMASQTQWTWVY